MRHPHDLKSASGIIVTRANTPEDVTSPSGNPICTRLPNRPRRPAGACSITIRDAPPHSPPRPMPWMSRKMTGRRMGPNSDLLVGREAPTTNVPNAMITIVIISMILRPIRSPK